MLSADKKGLTARQRALKRRRKFIAQVVVVFLLLLGTICLGVYIIGRYISKSNDEPKSVTSITSSQPDNIQSNKTSDNSQNTQTEKSNDDFQDGSLDKEYKNLMLINAKHPLPDNYDSEIREYLVEIDPQLRNNNYVTKIHKNVYPYITAMVRAANDAGVDLKVWSPFRSYADQRVLFENQVSKNGGNEQLAATVVARPGTSEHNSGICADFNMADDAFEQTEMYKWMCENAENYGFILRYPKDKQDKTGVIYESWHWRFVGIEEAKKINKSGLCLEEYLEQNNINQKITVDGF